MLRHDPTGRIQQSLHPQGNPGLPEETFRYDQAANLLDDSAMAGNGASGGWVHNNRLRVYQDKRYDWDGFGRMVCKRIGNHTTQRFSYDSEHRLTQVDIETTRVQAGGSQTVWFEYDPMGRRTAKTSLTTGNPAAQAKRTQFQWDGMRLLQEEAGYNSSLYIYEDSEGYEPLAKIESDLRSLYQSENDGKGVQREQSQEGDSAPAQTITAANDQHYEDGWPISPQHTQRSFTISSIAGSVQGAGATRQFDPKSLLQAAQSAPSYLTASKASLPMRVLYFHNDVNGAPEELTDQQGEIIWNVSYQVWGNTFRETYQPSEITRQNIRFQGQYLDRETGLHYNTFRYYDPDVGRFTSADPIGLFGSLNLYQYSPNPIMWIDPWGWCGTPASKRPPKISWSTARRNFWKGVAAKAKPGQFGRKNMAAMRAGRAPRMRVKVTYKNTRTNRKKGRVGTTEEITVPMELDHLYIPQRAGSTGTGNQPWNLQPSTPWGHASRDKFRNLGYG